MLYINVRESILAGKRLMSDIVCVTKRSCAGLRTFKGNCNNLNKVGNLAIKPLLFPL